jgi:hypothetical protein
MQDKLARIEQKIAGIKAELQKIGKMRPGSLTYQYQKPKEKKGGFWQTIALSQIPPVLLR